MSRNVKQGYNGNVFEYFLRLPLFLGGMRYHSWLRHYATSRKAVGSIPYEVSLSDYTASNEE
jgi:hypothetical protein